MRPGGFKWRFIFIRVIIWIGDWRQSPKCISLDHSYHLRVNRVCEYTLIATDVVQHFIQSRSLDLLGPQVQHGVRKLKDEATLLNLLHEQTVTFLGGGVWMQDTHTKQTTIITKHLMIIENLFFKEKLWFMSPTNLLFQHKHTHKRLLLPQLRWHESSVVMLTVNSSTCRHKTKCLLHC